MAEKNSFEAREIVLIKFLVQLSGLTKIRVWNLPSKVMELRNLILECRTISIHSHILSLGMYSVKTTNRLIIWPRKQLYQVQHCPTTADPTMRKLQEDATGQTTPHHVFLRNDHISTDACYCLFLL